MPPFANGATSLPGPAGATKFAPRTASALTQLEETELAVRWLRQAAVDGYPCYPLFENDPGLNNIRRDARFIQFMAELKRQWEYYKATL